MKEMKIGDKVRITKWTYLYLSVSNFISKNGTKEQKEKWKTVKNMEQINEIMEKTYIITNIEIQNDSSKESLAIIESDTHIFLVNLKGLQVVEV